MFSFLLFFCLGFTVSAARIADVYIADSIELDGQQLLLNGAGLREFLFVDIYVGAMYLPQPTHSETDAIQADVPKRIEMHFIYKHVTREQMLETFQEGLEKNPQVAQLRARLDGLYAIMQDAWAGDRVVIDYVPGLGTTIDIAGRARSTFEGYDFMQAIWTLFIGPHPPSRKLKRGLLGN